ncbi:hypothetical protein NLX85_18170 [Micromonospora sp. A3M-1-15]|uniref:hypothetical protein n=1 Tax=Micromonospora sp. A3M-1-15 TaxID=2962035 RepID=UPI0020B70ABD|nr:hypothetical protein [Micromonospora sp. A3M-1-15]MCP3785293.1 hypothetical protein [Micromonospora sp. A3M-1-15]
MVESVLPHAAPAGASENVGDGMGGAASHPGVPGSSGQLVDRLPGPAAVRKLRDVDNQDRAIATWQMVALVVLLVLAGSASWFGYGRIRYHAPPLRDNAESAAYELSVPARIDSMRFEIKDLFTTIQFAVSGWDGERGVTLSSHDGDRAELLQAKAQAVNGESIEASGWRAVTSGDGYLELVPQMGSPPSSITLTLRNGSLTRSGQYQFLRTKRIDIDGADGSAETAAGLVLVNSGSYIVERLATGGVSRPGETEGTTSRYAVTVTEVFGSHRSVLPVPAVSIDMVDVELQRGRDPLLLALGAGLGFAGGVLIEIVLTAAHLIRSRRRTNPPAGSEIEHDHPSVRGA